MAHDVLLKMEGISKSFPGVKALDNVTLEVKAGTVHALMGENGAGKSTLIKALAGIKEINKGNINREYKKSEAGYLPQYIQTEKNFPATVYEVVISGCLNKKGWFSFYNKEDKAKAEKNIKKMNIEDIKEKPFTRLSGGQKQRVLLARALCSAKNIIFLDEPEAGLDIKASRSMYDIIGRINADELMTVVMVSHDVLTASKYANKILHIDENDMFFGTTEEYMKTSYYKNILN